MIYKHWRGVSQYNFTCKVQIFLSAVKSYTSFNKECNIYTLNRTFTSFLFRNMSLLVKISVFWVWDQDTDLHAPLQGLGRILNVDIETRGSVLYKKQTKKMKRTKV